MLFKLYDITALGAKLPMICLVFAVCGGSNMLIVSAGIALAVIAVGMCGRVFFATLACLPMSILIGEPCFNLFMSCPIECSSAHIAYFIVLGIIILPCEV